MTRYGWLSRQTLTQSNGQVLQQFDYQRDANGNLTQRHSEGQAQFPALTASYRYDALDRLRQERYDLTPELNADYSFDPNGNRLTRQQGLNGAEADEIYSYAPKSNRLVDKDALMQADAAPEPVKDVTYDAKQRVRTLSVDGQLKAEYRYDARNLRTKKTLYDEAGAVSAEVYYHYDANGLLIGESDAQGQVRREYVYLGMMPVAQIDIDAQGQESVVYFLTDQLATPRLGIDQSQTIVWKWESDAYGSIAPSGSVTVNLRFAGQYFDAESGWYYNWNRYYLPKEGRYLTSDPIGLRGGLNSYGYSFQNPHKFVDRDGKHPIFWLALWGLASLTGDAPIPADQQISSEQQFLSDMLAPMPPLFKRCKLEKPDPKILNLGSGNRPLEGAVNLDIKLGKGVDVIGDARSLPFANECFCEIVGEMMPSPLWGTYGAETASEAYRVLKPGGTLSIHSNTQFGPGAVQAISDAGFQNIQLLELSAKITY